MAGRNPAPAGRAAPRGPARAAAAAPRGGGPARPPVRGARQAPVPPRRSLPVRMVRGVWMGGTHLVGGAPRHLWQGIRDLYPASRRDGFSSALLALAVFVSARKCCGLPRTASFSLANTVLPTSCVTQRLRDITPLIRLRMPHALFSIASRPTAPRTFSSPPSISLARPFDHYSTGLSPASQKPRCHYSSLHPITPTDAPPPNSSEPSCLFNTPFLPIFTRLPPLYPPTFFIQKKPSRPKSISV